MSETVEEKNNDSGVSPGHYETSPSPDHRSLENRSVSPCSAASHESHARPSCSYPYPQQNNYPHDTMPMDYSIEQSALNKSENKLNIDDQMDVVSSSMRLKREKPVSRTNRFEFDCPICGFKTMEKEIFWEHLKIHYNPNRLDDEPPVPLTLPIPGCTPEEISERIVKHEESINYPIINAQGKVKINRCKICKFRAITKVEFWRHIKIHTKLEKRLSCNYCPFVTDLKHHFEYHMNKQTGAKPFACKQCSYKCVNKSMLSSHMKSHTEIRQFSCADCVYVTKYCHSLKMHLRKYQHTPGPILHPDGSVNLFTTIDVYGTRRGPKQKKPTAKSSNESSSLPQSKPIKEVLPKIDINIKSDVDVTIPMTMPQQNLILNESQPITNPMNMINPFSGTGLNSILAMQYNHLLRNGFPIAEPYANNSEIVMRNINDIRVKFIAELMSAAERIRTESIPHHTHDIINYYNTSSYMDVPQPVADINAQYINEQKQNYHNNTFEVLDLSKPTNKNNNNNMKTDNNNKNNYTRCSSSSSIGSNVEDGQICQSTNDNQHINRYTINNSTPWKTSSTNRRKGRAFKLNKRPMDNDTDDENHSDDNITERATPESCSTSSEYNDGNFNPTDTTGNILSLKCNFCPISFGSEVMYAIHMGYHGYNDPYTCNICGQRCDDSLSFNVHLSRSSHA